MNEKKSLYWFQKVAYGSGDLGSNFMYTFVASFIMIYLTDTVGLNAGVIGTLMLVSRIFDGVSDVFFGICIDRTHSKMGKARPWMFWCAFPLAICEAILFMVPSVSTTIQYAYFFIVYTLLNAVFYTANNIAYASLTALITKNAEERVQLGSIRFIFAMLAAIIISSLTMRTVTFFGGGVIGWKIVAIIYSLIMLAFNSLAVLTVKELPEDHIEQEHGRKKPDVTIIQSLKLLLSNKYYIFILLYYIINQIVYIGSVGVGIYFCTYSLGNPDYLGVFTLISNGAMIVGLIATPIFVKKAGIYKVNLAGMLIGLAGAVAASIAGYTGNISLLMLSLAVKGLGTSPMLGTVNAVIADISTYTYMKDGVRIDGTMFSCSSMGNKVGGGLGTAISGWLLAVSGYDGLAAVQSESAISMIMFMYLLLPAICIAVMAVLLSQLNVEKGMEKLKCQN